VAPEDREALAEWIRAFAVGQSADYAGEHRLIRRDGALIWAHLAVTAFEDGRGGIEGAAVIVQDISATKAAQDRQALLLAELQHRTRNLIAVIRGIATRSSESADTVDNFLRHLQGRLSAIARTQAALTRSSEVSVSLLEILDDEFLATAASTDQVSVDGPDIRLRGKAAETMSLGLHELATNALKYGALSARRGRIDVSWTIDGDDEKILKLKWRESGAGPIDLKPTRVGFGRRLIEEVLPYELGAETSLVFAPGGVMATIDLVLDERYADLEQNSD
jgi:two-component system CheB/CheR fusion protein